MDYFGPFEAPTDGNTGILVIINHHFRFAAAVPVPKLDAEHTARAFVSEWIAKYDTLADILSDNGPYFTTRALQMI